MGALQEKCKTRGSHHGALRVPLEQHLLILVLRPCSYTQQLLLQPQSLHANMPVAQHRSLSRAQNW